MNFNYLFRLALKKYTRLKHKQSYIKFGLNTSLMEKRRPSLFCLETLLLDVIIVLDQQGIFYFQKIELFYKQDPRQAKLRQENEVLFHIEVVPQVTWTRKCE